MGGDITNDKISGYLLDSQQQQIVTDESRYLLVIAGAGSGKTLTILGKIYYLIKYKHVLPSEILCISFTRAAAMSLKEKIKKDLSLDLPVYTFHKLALNIVRQKEEFEIADHELLEHMIHEFFMLVILSFPDYMKMVLKYFKIVPTTRIKNQYISFCNNHTNQIESLEKLISTFLRLFKCNGYSIGAFTNFLKKIRTSFFNFNYKTEKIFLVLALNIYLRYQNYLNENRELDFDDMIIKASQYIDEQQLSFPFKYIMIDEYQDSSYIRFQFINAILKQTDARLIVVGDDFQSIYQFSGCDVSLFLQFKQYFANANIMKIENTYRNSQELITLAGNFVMKNKRQVKKNLHSNKHLDYPIQIIYYENIKETFEQIIFDIYQKSHKPIMVLGRNNKDIYSVLGNNIKYQDNGKIIFTRNSEIEAYYLTAHKSKGLEEENVIILNLENKLLGFPNKIKNDKILRLVSLNFDRYLYSEERRLFYVAITRTKNYVYLLVPKKNPSIFVKEIITRFNKKNKFVQIYYK